MKHTKIFLILAIIFTFISGAWATVRIVKTIQFDLNCGAYLKRAAEANTIELAKSELISVIKYAEENKLTEGIVSIFLKNPKNDIGFWYNNIKSAYEEIENLPENTSSLEKTNVLMKLRESLTDEEGVIVPEGITVYPNNVLYFWWGMVSCIATFVFWILYAIAAEQKNLLKNKETVVS